MSSTTSTRLLSGCSRVLRQISPSIPSRSFKCDQCLLRQRVWRKFSRRNERHAFSTTTLSSKGNFRTTKSTEMNPADRIKSGQVFPLGDFYQLITEGSQAPSGHPAYYPAMNATTQVEELKANIPDIAVPELVDEKLAQQEDLKARARVVFGSRLTGPQRWEAINNKSEIIAGVKVPPKPEEPDTCCMSGCVNCVWDLFREELEAWAAAKAEAQKALEAQDNAAGKKPKKSNKLVKNKTAPAITDATGMDEDGGRFISGSDMWEGFNDIPVGIRAFMETEKSLKQRRQPEQKT